MPFRAIRKTSIVALSLSLLSCSFNYNEGLDGSKPYPDMEMSGVSLSRYEDARVSMVFNAGLLELYDSDRVWAGTDIGFTQYSKDGKGTVENEASASLALIDDGASLYSLGGGVSFHAVKDGLSVEAEELQWAKTTNRLSGSESGVVEIRDDDGTMLRGTGFFADTLSREYWFSGAITGDMVNKGSDETDDATNADASGTDAPKTGVKKAAEATDGTETGAGKAAAAPDGTDGVRR